MTITLLHGSDVHFGKPHRPLAAEAFLDAAEELAPDAVVISGDLTQRAKASEYLAASHFLGRLPGVPCIVTPGNHDVPLFRLWERALAPFYNYRRFLESDLDTVTRIEGATLVALNSAAPRTAIVNGRVTDRQLGFAKRTFSATPASDVRIVVIHHNLVEAPDERRDPVLRGSARVLDALTDMKVDLVLGGHLHRAFLAEHARASAPQEKLLIVMSGTTTSGRGREAEKDRQSYNVVHIGDTTIEVRRFLSEPDAQGFVMVESITTPRRGKAHIVSEVGNQAETSPSAGQGR